MITIEERVKRLEDKLDTQSQTNLEKDIKDILARLFFDEQMIQTVSVAPSASFIPNKFRDQFVIYVSGATKRLYVYVNGTGGGWTYTTLT